ncbi:hypothetical protein VNO77_27867 [Canavalia gladiata]|uniref:Uncharacterized protein n=1 Tax=Canavalia gladiata TaxID=3824 RepID=A0AAN9Q7G2_CANGL
MKKVKSIICSLPVNVVAIVCLSSHDENQLEKDPSCLVSKQVQDCRLKRKMKFEEEATYSSKMLFTKLASHSFMTADTRLEWWEARNLSR